MHACSAFIQSVYRHLHNIEKQFTKQNVNYVRFSKARHNCLNSQLFYKKVLWVTFYQISNMHMWLP